MSFISFSYLGVLPDEFHTVVAFHFSSCVPGSEKRQAIVHSNHQIFCLPPWFPYAWFFSRLLNSNPSLWFGPFISALGALGVGTGVYNHNVFLVRQVPQGKTAVP